jgi:hypothetical protein
MQLVEYRRSDESDLVEAVFADAEEGKYLHIQKLGTRHMAREGRRPRIQYAEWDQRPAIGTEATDYEILEEGRNGAWLELDSRWHELMVIALGPGGSTAVLMRFRL